MTADILYRLAHAARDQLPLAHDAAEEVSRLRAELARLRAGIEAFLRGDYPNPGRGKCKHGQCGDCGNCADEWFEELLKGKTT